MIGSCVFCSSTNCVDSYLPGTRFNGKIFSYPKCKSCGLIYLNPLPEADDYVKMYPPSYQSGINHTIVNQNEKLPGLRFPYRKHYELMKKYASGNQILDHGCGQANFLINANHNGFKCDGTEYSPQHLVILEKEISGSDFFLVEDMLAGKVAKKYDVIRLSNVLEHLDRPKEILQLLSRNLKPDGVFLIEGPIETNPNFALFIRKIYFRLSKLLRPHKLASHVPTHIFFSNSTNQRSFFSDAGLDELYFEVTECEWPFPENRKEAAGVGGVLKFLTAKISKAISKFSGGRMGNTFIYIGKLN